MKEIIKSKYARVFLCGLALQAICAWFSIGFNHVDEHFQVLEFCSYKMGNTSYAILPWEFHEKVRASLLPSVAYLFARSMIWLGIYNPFSLAFLLRLLTGISGWFITCRLCLLYLPKMKTRVGEKLFIWMCLFLWFVPYLGVRFTPENVSGILFLYAAYFILNNTKNGTKAVMPYMLTGALLGVSFFIRFQMAFAIAGFAAWLIFIDKIKGRYFLLLAASAVVAICLNMLLDWWFYGEKVFTPVNYFYANIIQHRANSFGTNPWWFYFSEFLLKAIPPVSLVLLIMFFAGLYKNSKDPMVWAIVPFIIAHCITGHKELRFLFPVAFMFMYITALGFDYFLTTAFYTKIHKYIYKISVIICIPLLIYRTLAPAEIPVCYSKYLYNSSVHEHTPLFVLHGLPEYSMYGRSESFYRNDNIKVVSVDSLSQINKYLSSNQTSSALFLDKQFLMDGSAQINIKGYETKLVYSFFPSWISKFNINNWEKRTEIWGVVSLTKQNKSEP